MAIVPSTFFCPTCLNQQLELITTLHGTVERCPNCHAFLADARLLTAYADDRTKCAEQLAALNEFLLPTDRACPRCAQRLFNARVPGPNAILTVCSSCRGIWTSFPILKRFSEPIERALRAQIEAAIQSAARTPTAKEKETPAGPGFVSAIFRGLGNVFHKASELLEKSPDPFEIDEQEKPQAPLIRSVQVPPWEGKVKPEAQRSAEPSKPIESSKPMEPPKPIEPPKPVETPKPIEPPSDVEIPKPVPTKPADFVKPVEKSNKKLFSGFSLFKSKPKPEPTAKPQIKPDLPKEMEVVPPAPKPTPPADFVKPETSETKPVEKKPALSKFSFWSKPSQKKTLEPKPEPMPGPPEESKPEPEPEVESKQDQLPEPEAKPVPIVEPVIEKAPVVTPKGPATFKAIEKVKKPAEPIRIAPSGPRFTRPFVDRALLWLPRVMALGSLLFYSLATYEFYFAEALTWWLFSWSVGAIARQIRQYGFGAKFDSQRVQDLSSTLPQGSIKACPVELKGKLIAEGKRPNEILFLEDGSGRLPLNQVTGFQLIARLFGLTPTMPVVEGDITLRGWYRPEKTPYVEVQSVEGTGRKRSAMVRGLRWAVALIALLIGFLLLVTVE